ncbi:MAG: 2TM domain-containing protein [Pigmentiphaga sp.]|nr:2TM domain-containing protein [Pigmentiphaga sp.]
MSRQPPLDPELERLAQQRANAKLGWYRHAAIYVIVNLGLFSLAFHQGRDWAIYPALGWGLGLAIHGVAVWLHGPDGRWRERLVARERQALQRRHD